MNRLTPLLPSNSLPTSINSLLNLYAFFLAFPVVDVFGFSLTFYIFALIIFNYVRNSIEFIKKGRKNWLFWVFLLCAAISSIFHPPLIKDISPIVTIRNVTQVTYWVVLALYIKSNYYRINWYSFTKYLFWGLVLLVFVYYFFPIKLSTGFVDINFKQSRNGFVFNTLNFFPLIFWYVRNSKFKKYTILIIVYFVAALLISNGRAGFVLILFQSLLLLPAIKKEWTFLFRLSLMGVIFLISSWMLLEDSNIMTRISHSVESINPRAASLISKTGRDGDLSQDESWLIRKLMVDKSLEIFYEYPLLGVGWFNFSNYSTELNTLSNYEMLTSENNDYWNTRSAHNSYAQILGEGGILGFILLILILMPTVVIIFKRILIGGFRMNDLPLITMFTLLIYFYVISSLTGAGPWLVIGLVYGLKEK